jgi:hypothetical protein
MSGARVENNLSAVERPIAFFVVSFLTRLDNEFVQSNSQGLGDLSGRQEALDIDLESQSRAMRLSKFGNSRLTAMLGDSVLYHSLSETAYKRNNIQSLNLFNLH